MLTGAERVESASCARATHSFGDRVLEEVVLLIIIGITTSITGTSIALSTLLATLTTSWLMSKLLLMLLLLLWSELSTTLSSTSWSIESTSSACIMLLNMALLHAIDTLRELLNSSKNL